jgi:hypothetical protein
MSFLGFLKTAGKDFVKGLGFVVKDAPEITGLATLLFPASVAVTAPATLALTLLQRCILSIEQKYAASNAQSGTGAQKAADVLTLAGPAATHLLTQAGVPAVDDAYIGDLVKVMVGVLNLTAAKTTVTDAPAIPTLVGK